MKKIFIAIVFLIGLISFVGVVNAADYSITCSYGSGCSPSVPAFFPTTEVWYPGKTMTKTVQITNNSSTGQKIGFTTSNESATGGLDEKITMIITRSDSSIAWSGLLSAFYAAGETELMSNLGNGASETFAFAATMDTGAGNEYQDTTTQFDLTLGFISPLTGKTSSLSTSCTNTNFDTIMELKYDGVGQSGIKVKFTYNGEEKEATTGSNGKAQVGYTHTGDDTVKAEPEGGYPSQSVSFKLSSCNTVTSLTQTSTGGVLGAFTSFFNQSFPTGEGEVEGVATTPLPTTTRVIPRSERGEVEGVTTECKCIWWLILLGEALIAGLIFKKFGNDMNTKKWAGVLTGVGIGTYLLFRLVNQCLNYSFIFFPNTPSAACKYFVVWELSVLIVMKYFNDRQKKDSDSVKLT